MRECRGFTVNSVVVFYQVIYKCRVDVYLDALADPASRLVHVCCLAFSGSGMQRMPENDKKETTMMVTLRTCCIRLTRNPEESPIKFTNKKSRRKWRIIIHNVLLIKSTRQQKLFKSKALLFTS
jgi:hypothetical protein